jgi:hypothetical protein
MMIIGNIDCIIERAPVIERNEWDRRAIEVLQQARQAIQHGTAELLTQEEYIRGLQWALEQTLGTYRRYQEHAEGCEDDPRHYPQDLEIIDINPCLSCDTQAVIRHICETETMPDFPIFLDTLTRQNA